MNPIYDSIGHGYTATRAADSRISHRLEHLLALEPGAHLLDIGAGTGNYSCELAKAGYEVTALEPSEIMREQGKQHPKLSWESGYAEKLPFDDNSFDGVMMTLCMHHFSDWKQALREAIRVTAKGPIVILSFDAESPPPFWLIDYFPSFLENDKEQFPKLSEMAVFIEEELSRDLEIQAFPLPRDLKDHFLAAGWSRPEIYLDPAYRAGISSFSITEQSQVERGLKELEADLSSGEWVRRYGSILETTELDVGYVFLRIR
ncbi:class I SAM-dependent methyltransferase [Pelagicoccus mobilis]|uniref:Class I SAM-dependent methyltransferase n=1 Tax=Pelagicoccus mobilis TaxID=415221 RepID=A0A934S1A8_9BACT|nr:class I SAM-dependent methyltransferase [Pelagicoccus mobilis]MBK1880517.1 class I SAM-dependent methyltransferase [Pelagicoccus mobilis]